MNRIVIAGALTLSLALPAAASAHPGIFAVTAKVRPAGATCVSPDTSCLVDGPIQYAVGNDGWARSFTESNDVPPGAGRGLINYRLMPGAWRGDAKDPGYREHLRANAAAQTNLQPHATCLGAPWDTPATTLAWQEDPFFNYIPWQKTSAGLGDQPAEWMPVVKSITGVDLAALNTPAEFQAACQAQGGVYHAADTGASITDAQIAAATTAATGPLQSQITTLQSGVAAVTAQFNAADSARRALLARPLTLKLSGRNTGNIAMITGTTGTFVTLKLKVSSTERSKLKLGSATLATKTVTLDAQGAALVTLKPSAKARRAINRRVKITLQAAGGGATRTASGSYLD